MLNNSDTKSSRKCAWAVDLENMAMPSGRCRSSKPASRGRRAKNWRIVVAWLSRFPHTLLSLSKEEIMPRISLTDFVDIVSASGTPKATKVSQIKRRRPYQPAFDFYKSIRDHIIETHENKRSKETIRRVLSSVHDPKKLAVYPAVVAARMEPVAAMRAEF